MPTPTLLEKNIKRWELFSPEVAPHFYNLPELNKGTPPKENLDEWFRALDLTNSTVLYVYGNAFGAVYEAAKNWLSGDVKRQLVIFEDDCYLLREFFKTELADELLHHPQVYLFPLYYSDTDLYKDLSLFLELPYHITAIPGYKSHKLDLFNAFRSKVDYHLTITLRSLGEHLSMGDLFFHNYFTNLLALPDSYEANKLFGKFKNVPAIICGAGPSLEKSIPYLEKLKDKALIIGGGTSMNALNAKGFQPHLGAGLDPHIDQYYRILANSAYEVPYFYRNRLNIDALKGIHGQKLFINGAGGYPIADWIEKQLGVGGEAPEEGYNVVCFSVSLAKFLGCNPIILVGMDLAYTEKKSYSTGILNHPIHERRLFFRTKNIEEDLITTPDIYDKPVLTLWKWIMESTWFTDFVQRFPEITMINATEGGIGFKGIPNKSLKEILDLFETVPCDVEGRLFAAIAEAELPASANLENIVAVLNDLEGQFTHTKELIEKILVQLDEEKEPKELVQALENQTVFKEILYHFGAAFKVLYEREFFRFHVDKKNEKREREINVEYYTFLKKSCKSIANTINRVLDENTTTNQQPPRDLVNDFFNPEDIYQQENGRLTIFDKEMGIELDVKVESTDHQLINGLSEFKSKSGQLLSRSWYNKGKKIGKCWHYYANGQLAALLRYHEGKLQGTQIYFYPNGQKKTELNTKNGIYDGSQVLYYPNGSLKRELFYINGDKEGTEKGWNENGLQHFEAHYQHNRPVDIAKEWYPKGGIKTETIYSAEDPHYCKVKEYDSKGNLIAEEDLNKDDYFEMYSKKAKIFTDSLKTVSDNMHIVIPFVTQFAQLDQALSASVDEDLLGLKKELKKLEEMNKKLMEEVGLESHTEEPIWKSPQARKELEDQFDQVSVNLKQGLENVQKSLHEMVSKLNEIEKDLPKNE